VREVLAEERLRHEIPGVSGAYRHVTPAMRAEFTAALGEAWNGALGSRQVHRVCRRRVQVAKRVVGQRGEAGPCSATVLPRTPLHCSARRAL
jgi:hypothetical protein